MIKDLRAKLKDFIVVNFEQKIYPEEIEKFYAKAGPVKEICVFTVSGMGGTKGSKVLWAIIQPDLEEFRKFASVNLHLAIKERFDNASPSLPIYKRLKGFTVTLEDLPHDLFGKLDRNAIKEIYEPRVRAGIEGALPVLEELSAADHLLIESETGVKILKCLKEISGIKRPIILEDSLELDLGIDSLGRVELASCLELAFKVNIKDEAISRAFTVKDLILGVTGALKGAKEISLEDHQGVPLEPDYWKKHLQVLPKEEHLGALEFSTGSSAWLLRFTITAIDCLIFKLFFSIKEEGAENVPKVGGYILYPNHTSDLDGPAITACLPRRPVFQLFYFLFIPYFFRPFIKSRLLRNLVKMERLIPFDYSTHFLEALRSAYLVLKRGKGLCFFPEGLRSTTGEVGKFKKGFGILAKETEAKLVPVAIEGAYEAWPSTAKYPKLHPIRVRFGKPLLVEDLEKEGLAMGAKDSYEAICVAARRALIELKTKT
ncbi:MAG: 1-acyl-sn-glycerol-3-phosphate acyltransferase [Candidatus Omnitrophica bacterium]|nr:1-acyl-sn-glycerol-3-phosphate acyltransferase [Candidatus Omnitrophota bacterium]